MKSRRISELHGNNTIHQYMYIEISETDMKCLTVQLSTAQLHNLNILIPNYNYYTALA